MNQSIPDGHPVEGGETITIYLE
ncbi:hypothetical protein [Marinilabilia salmonicolor]|nr:hypothetical protein [Marinilabilia salmonicolor]